MNFLLFLLLKFWLAAAQYIWLQNKIKLAPNENWIWHPDRLQPEPTLQLLYVRAGFTSPYGFLYIHCGLRPHTKTSSKLFANTIFLSVARGHTALFGTKHSFFIRGYRPHCKHSNTTAFLCWPRHLMWCSGWHHSLWYRRLWVRILTQFTF